MNETNELGTTLSGHEHYNIRGEDTQTNLQHPEAFLTQLDISVSSNGTNTHEYYTNLSHFLLQPITNKEDLWDEPAKTLDLYYTPAIIVMGLYKYLFVRMESLIDFIKIVHQIIMIFS